MLRTRVVILSAALALAACAISPSGGPASKGEATLAAGLRQYDEGHYAESARMLQSAIEQGLPESRRVHAHKHLAFMHCASGRERACRDEFRRALAIDPTMDLDPAEAGHPVWGPIFRAIKLGR